MKLLQPIVGMNAAVKGSQVIRALIPRAGGMVHRTEKYFVGKWLAS